MHPTPKTAVGMQVTYEERDRLQAVAAARKVTLSTLLRTAITTTYPDIKLEQGRREKIVTK